MYIYVCKRNKKAGHAFEIQQGVILDNLVGRKGQRKLCDYILKNKKKLKKFPWHIV